MKGTWIHHNLESTGIQKVKTPSKNTCSKSTVETLEEILVCSKLTIETAMTPFRSGVDRVPKHRFSAKMYLFKFSNIDTKLICKICSKLTIKTPERKKWCHPGVFFVNFEHISYFALVLLLLTLTMYLLARLDEYNSIIIRGFQSAKNLISDISKWNTQLTLFEV